MEFYINSTKESFTKRLMTMKRDEIVDEIVGQFYLAGNPLNVCNNIMNDLLSMDKKDIIEYYMEEVIGY